MNSRENHNPDCPLQNIGAIELTPLKRFDHWKVSMKSLELILKYPKYPCQNCRGVCFVDMLNSRIFFL